jgi:hypothetical protein
MIAQQAVCTRKNLTSRVGCARSKLQPRAVFEAWAAPRGIWHLSPTTCTLNTEIGVNDAWLTVSHTLEPNQVALGRWFYYTRGCSDLAWSVGNSLKVRNRCHAAVALHMLAHSHSNRSLALARVSSHLMKLLQQHGLWPSVRRELVRAHDEEQRRRSRAREPSSAHARTNVSSIVVDESIDTYRLLAAAMDRCAHQMRCVQGGGLQIPLPFRRVALWLARASTLDFVNWHLLSRLREMGRPLDTIQLVVQPQARAQHVSSSSMTQAVGRTARAADQPVANAITKAEIGAGATRPVGDAATSLPHQQMPGKILWATEIWDVRVPTRSMEGAREHGTGGWVPYSWTNGSACQLSENSPFCLSCSDSQLEGSCYFGCRRLVPQSNASLNASTEQPELVGTRSRLKRLAGHLSTKLTPMTPFVAGPHIRNAARRRLTFQSWQENFFEHGVNDMGKQFKWLMLALRMSTNASMTESAPSAATIAELRLGLGRAPSWNF